MYEKEITQIANYILANHPLFYIQHQDYVAIKEILVDGLKKKLVSGIRYFEFTNALGGRGLQDPYICEDVDLYTFLRNRYEDGESIPQILILKDISNYYNNSEAVSFIKTIAEKSSEKGDFTTIIFIVDSTTNPYPKELENLLTFIDIKPLSDQDIEMVIKEFIEKTDDIKCAFIDNPDSLKQFAYSFKGLQKYQIEQILNTTKAQRNGEITTRDTDIVLAEKKQLIKKSGILEIIDRPGSINEIGGLENLIDWLKRKAEIFKDIVTAESFGVSIPKGILIAGMPGCGKSLTAKATASLFEVPLVRLDIGSLLGKYVGESEGNMKKALSLSEAFSPCVLWIDELEKAFAGIKNEGDGNEIVTRLFGQFLTWMQEKKSSVFIVATANNIASLPPEFLRKGRFDELFMIDLPNENEIKEILQLKLQAKKKTFSSIDLEIIARKAASKGCNGGDIETIVNDAIENKFMKWKKDSNESKELSTEEILNVLNESKSIKETLGKKLDDLKSEMDKYHLKPASK